MTSPTPELEDPFVFVRVKSTGESQSIPRAWLDHPVLGADFELGDTSDVDLSGSVDAVLERVGESKAHAEVYLKAEKAAKARKGVVEGLQAVLDGPDPDDDPNQS